MSEYKRLKQCTYCSDCDKTVADRKLSLAVRAKWAERKRRHRQRVAAEKQKYYHHRHKATVSPLKYISIIMDGSDEGSVFIGKILEFQEQMDAESEDEHWGVKIRWMGTCNTKKNTAPDLKKPLHLGWRFKLYGKTVTQFMNKKPPANQRPTEHATVEWMDTIMTWGVRVVADCERIQNDVDSTKEAIDAGSNDCKVLLTYC